MRAITSALVLVSVLCLQCNTMKEKEFVYGIEPLDEPLVLNSQWDKEIWTRTRGVSLKNFMGEYPAHFPETRAKLRYDGDHIYVIFHVRDRYVRAVAKKTNGRVWEDSCVEFFFSPGPDTERGYFNFEINCKGVFLFQYHLEDDQKDFVSEEDCKRIKVSYSFFILHYLIIL